MTDDGDSVSGHTLTLADGTVINTRTGRPMRGSNGVAPGYVAIPTNAEAVREVAHVRRRLADLPDVPARMNVVCAAAAYHMFGLEDFEIAHALGCTEAQVGRMRMTEAFTRLVETMTQNIVETQADDVRALIENHASSAARNVISLMQSEDDKVAIVAAKDILDRAGHRPADVIEHRHKIEGGLTIEYVKKDAVDALPVFNIDISAEDA